MARLTNTHTHAHAHRRKKRFGRAVRTASDERSAQSEIYETSDNIAKRLDDRPDRLVFPIYRKYLIPNKPGQTKPKPAKPSDGQTCRAGQAAAGARYAARTGRISLDVDVAVAVGVRRAKQIRSSGRDNNRANCLSVARSLGLSVGRSVCRSVSQSVSRYGKNPKFIRCLGCFCHCCWALWLCPQTTALR